MTSGAPTAQEISTMECVLLDIEDLEFVVPILTRELERMRAAKRDRKESKP
jgi:uncharacterized small protein (DUF1192 family)